MTSRVLAIFGAAALLVTAATETFASETVYRWTDAKGEVHYGSNPPVGVKADLIRVRSGTAISGQDAPELTPAEKQQIEYCETARKNLELLSGPTDIMRVDEYGQKRKLTAEEKAAERGRAEEAVRKQCPSGA